MSDYPRHDADGDSLAERGRESITGTPRWVKAFGIILSTVVLLALILLFTRDSGRGHGPSRHTSPEGTGGRTPAEGSP